MSTVQESPARGIVTVYVIDTGTVVASTPVQCGWDELEDVVSAVLEEDAPSGLSWRSDGYPFEYVDASAVFAANWRPQAVGPVES